MVASGDFEGFKTLMEGYQPDARLFGNSAASYGRPNAFGLPGLTVEMAEWLKDYGSDINMEDNYQHIPLEIQVRDGAPVALLEKMIALGADVHHVAPVYPKGAGVLHMAADARNAAATIAMLLAQGLDPNMGKGEPSGMPLESAVQASESYDLETKIDGWELLRSYGAEVTDEMREAAQRIAGEARRYEVNERPEEREVTRDAVRRLFALCEMEE